MRASGLVTAVTVALVLAGCSADDDGADDSAAPAPRTCEISLDNDEIERKQLAWLDHRGPNIDRDLSASVSPKGDLCVEIVTDHADPGSTAVSYSIVVRQGDREWRIEGEDPSGARPLLVDAQGCVRVIGKLEVAGAGDRTSPYRAIMRVRCPEPDRAA